FPRITTWATGLFAAEAGVVAGCSSFAETTPVATLDGLRPISELKAGDSVLAQNEVTGAYAFEPITKVFRHQDPVKVHLTLEDLATGATEVIETTPEHPFHVPARGFVPAASLKPGDAISRAAASASSVVRLTSGRADTSEVLRVKTLAFEDQPFWAYNLEVSEHHTFFVGASRAWVHNALPCLPILTKLGEGAKRSLWRQATNVIWPKIYGSVASSRGLDVHHRIPLEWAQLFPKANPNRISNLIG